MNTIVQKLVVALSAAMVIVLVFWLFPNHLKPQEVLPFAFLVCFFSSQNKDFRLHKPSDGTSSQSLMFFSSALGLLSVAASLVYLGYMNGIWAGVMMFVAAIFIGALLSQILTTLLGNPHRLALLAYIGWPISAYLVYLFLLEPEKYRALLTPILQA